MTYPTVSRAVSGGYYMTNLENIARWLMTQGFSRAAAAGVAGTIAGESAGNPESVGSGGAGLIGWTPPTSAKPVYPIVTGNWQTDFDNQLRDLLYYAETNSAEAVARGGVNLATLKAATSPQQAATWWSAFEGPAVPGSDIRTSVVTAIYNALGTAGGGGASASGSLNLTPAGSSSGSTAAGSGGTAELTSIGGDVSAAVSAMGTIIGDTARVINFFFEFFQPGQVQRVGAAIVCVVASGAVLRLYMTGQQDQQMPAVFALILVALISGYMAAKPWRQAGGKSITVADYIRDLARGSFSGTTVPTLPDETVPIETGLTVALTLWVIGKVSGAASGILGTLGNFGAFLDNAITGATSGTAGTTAALDSAVTTTASSSGYANPLRAVTGLTAERIDQGVDYAGTGPVYALGPGTVTWSGAAAQAGWPGSGYIAYRLSAGPYAGRYVYVAEDITPSVRAGQSVTSQTIIGQMYQGAEGIEIGWGSGQGTGTMAQVYSQQSPAGDPGSRSTAFGQLMSQLLASLGAPAGKLQGAVAGTIPSGWPSA